MSTNIIPVPGQVIPTPAQLAMALLGRLGKGHAELVHLVGTCVDYGYSYPHCVEAVPEALRELVAAGKLEAVDVPSQYTQATYRVWRLPSSVPMESPAAPVAVPAGHISASDFRAQGGKRKGGRG